MPYTFKEHTADLLLEATGETLEEAFIQAAKGMMSSLFDLDTIDIKEDVPIEVEAPDMESLFVKWLQEVLYRYETEGMLFREFSLVITTDPPSLKGTASGERFDPKQHKIITEIKAVTYHMLEVEYDQKRKEARVQVLFDI